MVIGAIAPRGVAGKDRIAFAPSVAKLGVSHRVDGVVVQGSCSYEIATVLICQHILDDGVECLGVRHLPLGREECCLFACIVIHRLFLPLHTEFQHEGLFTVRDVKLSKENLVAELIICQHAMGARHIDFGDANFLECVALREGNPHLGCGIECG